MTQPSTVTVGPNLAAAQLGSIAGALLICGGFIIPSLLVGGGLGPATAVGCAIGVSFGIVAFVVVTVRQRPRVVITPHGFTIDKFIGSDSHKWEDIDGQFVVTKMGGWTKVVGYRLTGEFNTRAIVGRFLSSPEMLAALLNEHKQRNMTPPTGGPKVDAPA